TNACRNRYIRTFIGVERISLCIPDAFLREKHYLGGRHGDLYHCGRCALEPAYGNRHYLLASTGSDLLYIPALYGLWLDRRFCQKLKTNDGYSTYGAAKAEDSVMQQINSIGFIGVGLMGHGMAANLISKGFDVTVMGHRNRIPVDDLVSRGAREAM